MSLRTRELALLGACAAAAAIFVTTAAQAEVLISSGATANITCTGGVCTPSHVNAILNVTQVEDLLNSGSVKITTAGSKASSIVISAPLSWASVYGLTLDAYQSITVNRAVSVNGTGGLTLTTNDGGTGGALSFGAKGNIAFLSTANSLTINGAAYTLVGDTATLASDIAASPSGNFALASDYNASGSASFVTTTFNGNFEGLGNVISNLTISSSSQNFGLFSEVGSNGAITSIRLTKASVSDSSGCQESTCEAVGSLVGLNYGTLFGDSAAGAASIGEGSGGGIVGENYGTINGCYSSVKIAAHISGNGGSDVGGLVGFNENGATIVGSYATGSVIGNGHFDGEGGLTGTNEGIIANSFAAGSVTGSHNGTFGGLVGSNAPVNGTGVTLPPSLIQLRLESGG